MAPFWRQIPPKTPPRCLQDALGRPSLVPKRSQEPPKRRPRCAKNRPRAAPEASWKRPIGALGRRHAAKHPQTPSRPRFWTILATIWKDFGIILDGFLERFSNKLDPYSRNYPLAVLGGLRPPLLRGAHLEERTVAGTPLCGARDNTFNHTGNNTSNNSKYIELPQKVTT